MKRDEEALELADRVHKSLVRQLGPGDLETCNAAIILGDSLMYTGKYAEAEELQIETLRHVERVVGKDHPMFMEGTFSLAFIYRKQGEVDKAIEMFDRTLEARRRVLGAKHPKTMETIHALGKMYMRKGELERAESLLEEAAELRGNVLGDDDYYTLKSKEKLEAVRKQQQMGAAMI